MSFTLTIETAAEVARQAQAEGRTAIIAAIDAAVEAQAKSLGYNSAAHLAGYVTSTVEAWAAEAAVFIAWRDAMWTTALALQDAAAAEGVVPELDAVTAALPDWPG